MSKQVLSNDKQSKKQLIPEKYQTPLFILLIIASVFVFFWGAISGGGFNASDNVASSSFVNYLDDAKKTGEFPQWIPYIFGGMPSYASLMTTGVRSWDVVAQVFFGVTKAVGSIFASDVARVICFYIIYGIGMFLLMRSKKHERLVSFITAFAAMFSTYVITWVMIGHNTKPIILALFPYVFLLLEKLRVKFSLLYTILLVFVIHIMYEGSHVQMTFYFACAVALYFIFELVNRLMKKDEPVKVIRSASLLIISAVIAFLMSSDRYLTTLEYTPSSTRGTAPISQVEKQHVDAPQKDYKYSTQWSYNPGETFSMLVPGFFGTKPIEFNGQEQAIYFGAKESEDSPPYMGIGILALAIIGCILYRKDAFVQALLGISIFSLIISFGKNAPSGSDWYIVLLMLLSTGLVVNYFLKGKIGKGGLGIMLAVFLVYVTNLVGVHSFDMFKLYDVMFWNLPMFYTFRAPSMALAMLNFAVPVLAGFGLTGIIKMNSNMTKNEKILVFATVGVSLGFLISGFIYSGGFQDTFAGFVKTKLAPMVRGEVPSEIIDGLWNAAISDWYFSAFVLIAFALGTYFFVQKKINKGIYLTALLVLFAVDLWRVDYRPMEVSEEKLDAQIFAPYEQFYAQIKADNSLFRVADFAAPHNNAPAHFRLQSVGGYHPAKLRVYQDLMDVANMQGYEGSTHDLVNPFLWNLMNVKYIIQKDQKTGAPAIYPNPEVLPRAFFVKNYAVAKPMEILQHLKKGDFNPKDTMFLEKSISEAIVPADSTAKADITEFKNEYIKINAQATGNNLLFISEVYYQPSWKAYIDGKETPILKANYAFRAVVVPQGNHTIEMKFHSDKFETGKTLSLAVNIITILAGGVGIFLTYRKRKEEE